MHDWSVVHHSCFILVWKEADDLIPYCSAYIHLGQWPSAAFYLFFYSNGSYMVRTLYAMCYRVSLTRSKNSHHMNKIHISTVYGKTLYLSVSRAVTVVVCGSSRIGIKEKHCFCFASARPGCGSHRCLSPWGFSHFFLCQRFSWEFLLSWCEGLSPGGVYYITTLCMLWVCSCKVPADNVCYEPAQVKVYNDELRSSNNTSHMCSKVTVLSAAAMRVYEAGVLTL